MKILTVAIKVIVVLLLIITCIAFGYAIPRSPEPPHLKPVDTELIQTYKDTIAHQQEEIDSLRELNKQLRQERFELLEEMNRITDGYLDRFLELLEGDKGGI